MDRRSKILPEIHRICEKIESVLQRKKQLNLSSKLRDFDYKNCGLISDTKFFNVIHCQLGEEFGLSEAESRELTKYFKKEDGRVDYIEFLEKIDFDEFPRNHFVSGFEWDDPDHVNVLTSMETRTLKLVITKIAYLSKVKEGLLWLEPLFQDYKSRARNGSMTIALFRKILYQAGITLGEKEFNIIVKRYSRHNFTVNYDAFLKDVQTIEKWLIENGDLIRKQNRELMPGKVLTADVDKLPRPEIGNFDVADKFQILKCGHPSLERNAIPKCPELVEILSKIKKIVAIKGVNAKQFFMDFDTLNCGLITKSQFHRGLEAMGISGLHGLTITAEDLNLLVQKYKENWDDGVIERVKWRKFCDDIAHVPDFENNYKLIEISSLQRIGSNSEWLNSDDSEISQNAIMKIRKVVKAYKIAIESYFKGFDKLNRCHVSPIQMRRVLASHSILLSEEEYKALLARYRDDIGFNYRKFLQELDETCWCDDSQKERSTSSKSDVRTPSKKSRKSESSVIEILAKVRNEILRKRTSLGTFMKSSHIRKGNISRDQFKSSFTAAGIIIDADELDKLCKAFAAILDPFYVNYCEFCMALNRANHAGNLEVDSEIDPQKLFGNNDEDSKNFLNYEERNRMAEILQNILRSKVNISSLGDVFKDYAGRCHIITRYSLEKVIKNSNIPESVTSNDLDLIFKCYSMPVGLINRKFNYDNFIEALQILRDQ